MVEDAPADAVAGLQHDDAAALLLEAARGGQAGEAGPDDDDINGFHGGFSLVNGVQAVSATAGTATFAGRRTSATITPAAAAATSSQGSALIQPTVLPVRVL